MNRHEYCPKRFITETVTIPGPEPMQVMEYYPGDDLPTRHDTIVNLPAINPDADVNYRPKYAIAPDKRRALADKVFGLFS